MLSAGKMSACLICFIALSWRLMRQALFLCIKVNIFYNKHIMAFENNVH